LPAVPGASGGAGSPLPVPPGTLPNNGGTIKHLRDLLGLGGNGGGPQHGLGGLGGSNGGRSSNGKAANDLLDFLFSN